MKRIGSARQVVFCLVLVLTYLVVQISKEREFQIRSYDRYSVNPTP
jgi:hypothetical protein